MSDKKQAQKDLILFIGTVPAGTIEDIQNFNKRTGRKLKVAMLYDSRLKKAADLNIDKDVEVVIACDSTSHTKITQALLPYHDRLLAVTCRNERSIPLFQKIIPHVPYLRTPTSESLEWATNKVDMRRKFRAYDKKITPLFTVVSDSKKDTLKKIESKVGFPLVVKPSGLAQSLLVSICYHKDELEKVLKVTFRKINKIHKAVEGRGQALVLVEQFMEGEMYSVDGYVTSRGKIHLCPFVNIKTGKSIGFDDFFGYQQITPTLLKKQSIEDGEVVARKSVHALGIRSSTVHVELMKTESGWKVIEVGPRVGGFRQKMYELSYGIDHTMNDILIRIPEPVVIPKKVKGYTACMKFFAQKEGKLTKLTGIKKAQELKSFYSILVNKKIGDRCMFAKNGGISVFNITLFNADRSHLLADIRRLEQMIEIVTK